MDILRGRFILFVGPFFGSVACLVALLGPTEAKASSSAAFGLLIQEVAGQVQIRTLAGELAVDSISDDLLLLVGEGGLTEEEAQQIEADLRRDTETTYVLPRTTGELRTALGFLPDTVIDFTELATFLAIHAQLSLGVSPLTAAYIVRAVPLEVFIELPSARARPVEVEAHADAVAL